MEAATTEKTLLQLTRDLLDCISAGDWTTYTSLCDEGLTCFEPEAKGHLVEGLPFHKFYFDLPKNTDGGIAHTTVNTTMASPKATVLGGGTVGLVTYVRLFQKLDGAGKPVTLAFEETRIWHKVEGVWKHVHFHRS